MDVIKLWEKTPDFDPEKGLEEPCLLDRAVEGADKCVIVIPGGGYFFRAEDHEGEPIAAALNAAGISAFILRYRHNPYRHPIPQNDVNRAVRLVRSMAKKYGYAADKIAVLGFSAGGHLAATAACFFDYGRDDGDEIDKISSRPDLAVLCYPVITIGSEFTHWGTTNCLLGEEYDKSLAEKMSCEKSVRDDTPHCFIWTTAGDRGVPPENSLMMAAALSAKKIPFELHVFPYGDHGLGLATGDPHVAVWMDLCIKYIRLEFDAKGQNN